MQRRQQENWTIRRTAARAATMALAAALVLPAAAQDSPPPARPETAAQPAPDAAPETAPETAPEAAPEADAAPDDPAAAAAARLDFPAALAELAAAIAADPTAPAPRLARAEIHMKMQRPALALADLGAVLAADPANLDALRARIAIWDGQQAWTRARDDLDAALAAAPGDPQILALRGQLNARSGLTEAARADFAAALAAAPGDPEITRLRDQLLGTDAAPAAPSAPSAPAVVFGEEAVMSPDFTVALGAPEAPATLHIVHAATDLAAELTAVDPSLIDRAVAEQALRVVHLFTYTGDEASIWGSLALICAGPEGYAATHAALSDTSGSAALAAAGAGDMAPLDRLLTAAYSVAGIDEGLVGSCALDRPRATRYLADWHAHRDAGAWRGVDLLDHWPVWVLDGTPLDPIALGARLEAMAPTPQSPAETAPSDETAAVSPAAPTPPGAGGTAAAAGEIPVPPAAANTDTEDTGAEDTGTETVAALAGDAAAPPASDSATPGDPESVAPEPDAPEPDASEPDDPAQADTAPPPSDDAPAPAETDTAAPVETAQVTTPDTAVETPDAADPAVPPSPPGAENGTAPLVAANPQAPTPEGPATPAPDAPDAPAPDAPTPDTLAAAPASPETAPAPPGPSETPAPDQAPDQDQSTAQPTAQSTPPSAPEATADTTVTAPPAQAAASGPASGPARFPDRPAPVDTARVPVELRGIYAPSLAACLDYLAAIEEPDRIDAVLPGINPLDGPALGTILVTSRRAYLFNALDTECAIAGDSTGAAGWEGRFACASPLAPEAAPTLALTPAEPDGTAPRISAGFGTEAPVTLRQCRALGQLGNAFAPLWTRDEAACSVGAAVEQGRFAFSIDRAGDLALRVTPSAPAATAETAQLHAVIDGAAIGAAPGRWDGTGWQMSLGPFAETADRLGWGMFLDLRTAGDPFEARLPLFGSSAAMTSLETCAPPDP
ncbi:MAG: hypothetical protein KDK28_16345 [Maritimibacter sp.]|nr:hypothetical protein [Maritimibacter sp.]